jgi:hypothetical protein
MITLTEMSSMVSALLEADAEVERAEERLKMAKEVARIIREETIPSAMQELGLQNIVLDTGQSVKVVQDVYASIPESQKLQAHNWLDGNGFGGLIKVDVIVPFSKGEKKEAEELAWRIGNMGYNTTYKESIHAQTLKAFLREQLSAGKDVPLDLFGARPVWTAKIGLPNKKK